MIMGKHKGTDLRRRCLTRNVKQYLDSIKCSNETLTAECSNETLAAECSNETLAAEAFIHQVEVLPSSILLQDHSYSKLSNQENLKPTENEQKVVVQTPSKRFMEDDSQKLMPHKKKIKVLKPSPHTPIRGKPFGEVTKLPQIHVSTSQKSQPIPDEILLVYVETQAVLNNAERDIKSFFEIDDNTVTTKDGTPAKRPIKTKVTETTVFQEIDDFALRHIYKKFYNARLILGQRLREAIEKTNKYLFLLRRTIQMLPVYSDYVPKLIDLFNKTFSTYQAHPAHKAYKVVCRQLVLLKVLITKFNKKHGLSDRSSNLLEIQC